MLQCMRETAFRQNGPFRSLKWPAAVNQRCGENFEVGVICLPSRFRTNTLLVDYRPQLAEGSASPAFGFVSSRARGRRRHQSRGEPESRGIMSRKRASIILKLS